MPTDTPLTFPEAYPALLKNEYDLLVTGHGTKEPAKGEPWRNRAALSPTDCEVISKRHPRGGVGLRTGRVIAVDLDIKHSTVARLMREFVELFSGAAPTRIGLPPKALMIYRADARFSKVTSPVFVSPDGAKHKVEILADGQYFVAFGIHPDTDSPYQWVTNENPLNTPLSQLESIKAEHGLQIVDEFERLAIAMGWRKEGERIPRSTYLSDPNDWTAGISRTDPETVENVDRVRSALGTISADCSRDEWRNVLFAILSTGWTCAGELCREWSLTAPDRFDGDGLRNVLDSAKADRPNGITLGTLFAIAKGNGWVDPRKAKQQFDSYGDISNGRRFADRFRGSFLFVHATSTWYVWNGQRWKPCDTGEAMAAAKAIADECISETLSKLKEEGTEAAKRSHTQALGVHRSIQKLEAMLKAASTEPGMSIAHPGLFDSDPLKINVRNGVLDLKTGQLLPALPEMHGSRLAGVEYDRLAQCPRWLDFVHATMNGDSEMVAFMQRVCGYALTGLVDEEVLFFFYGTGANGKSVFANVILAAFGEYGVTVRAALLARDHKGSGSDAEREKARLPGSRITLMNETGQADMWDDQRMKEMVSREKISARQLYAESFEFMPTHKLFIRGNHQPGAMDSGEGFWRRIVLIGFTRQFSEAERVPDLDRQIIERELPGVFAWMVDGCLHWQKYRLQIPKKVKDAVNAYRKDTDLMGEWLESECIRRPDVEGISSELFTNYVNFLKAANVNAPSRSVFGRQLVQRGFRKRESNGKTFYVGLAIRCPFDPDEL